MFFKPDKKTKKSETEYPYDLFIPIVEQIRDYKNIRTWCLAMQSNVARKFYPSIELLEQCESSRLRSNQQLSCYIISLNTTEYSQLQVTPSNAHIRVGFLSFEAERIQSLVTINKENNLEHVNPFYSGINQARAITCAA
ncbi:hypothetical protein [Legionella hackeliae]|uniref:Uncharacterized protein n=1 Tax=Legionella hackeliae TaxID=449 RepID=A0A0A8UU02_LEGHA|nr:hypothetical protein [Legionella hackeliae]KTD13861.1 hypothetical protein Lhac_0705 [Legionella hackeliae]CEK10562.1 protein of unknown function [Legionella hackeliae]STX47302.1 Uncharacterised protein [Legionella hackeliae]